MAFVILRCTAISKRLGVQYQASKTCRPTLTESWLFYFLFYLVCHRYNNLKNKKREKKTKKYIQCDRDMVTGHSPN